MAYLRARLVVLTGSAGSGRTCCDSVAAQTPGRGALRAGRVIPVGVSGPVEGALVPDGGRLLAIVASEQGVWASLSAPGGDRFGPPRRLSLAGQFVQSLATAPDPSGGVNIVWSARTGSPVAPGPTELLAAHAAPGRAPGSGRPILRVPGGRALDELALAPGATPTLAWVQSAYTRAGRFDAGVWTAPLSGGRLHPSRASSPRVIAGGLVAAGGPGTPQVVSWRGCGASGACVAQAILVPAAPAGRVPLGPALTLGRTEPEEQPAAGVSAAGRPVVAWVDDRGVRASSAVGRPLLRSANDRAHELRLGRRPRSGRPHGGVRGLDRGDSPRAGARGRVAAGVSRPPVGLSFGRSGGSSTSTRWADRAVPRPVSSVCLQRRRPARGRGSGAGRASPTA